ncbi:unnamed protein product [Jaminaea pallidilutea]
MIAPEDTAAPKAVQDWLAKRTSDSQGSFWFGKPWPKYLETWPSGNFLLWPQQLRGTWRHRRISNSQRLTGP